MSSALPWYRTGQLPAIFYAVALAVIVCFVPLQSTSRADANIIVLAALGGATVLTSCWFTFLSPAPLAWRKNWAIYSTSAVALFFALLKVESTSGDVLPNFTWRWWGQKADYAISDSKVESTSGDVLPNFTWRWWGQKADYAVSDERRAAGTAGELPGIADYPGFLGPRRDGILRGLKLARDWDARPPRKIWQGAIGAGWSAFAISGNVAVTMEQRGEEECVVAYAAATGRVLWKHATPGRFISVLGGDGPRGTPYIENGRVYALGATGNLSALDLKTGKPLWPPRNILKDVGSDVDTDDGLIAWGRSASPLIVQNLLIVPGGGPDEQHAKSLLAYDKNTGEFVTSGGTQQVSYSSPSLHSLAGQEQVVIVNESSVSGHDPATLAELWQIPWNGGSSSNASASQTHKIGEDLVFVSKSYGVGGMVFRVSRAGETWSAKKVWHNPAVLKTKLSNVAIAGNYAFGLSDGRLQCVDLQTGKRQWAASGEFGHGQMLLVDDLLLILSEEGELSLCEANPRKYVPLAAQQVLTGKSWAHPALAGKYLFVRNATEAACYELPLAE